MLDRHQCATGDVSNVHFREVVVVDSRGKNSRFHPDNLIVRGFSCAASCVVHVSTVR